MLINFLQHFHLIIPIVGICIIVIIAAISWAIVQIRNLINRDFVDKLDCERCMNKAKDEYRDEMDEKYKSLEDKIDQMSKNFAAEMKEVRTSTEQWIQTAVRIETKVDLLLQGYKHE